MRKIWIFLFAMLLLVTSVCPVVAEEEKITPDITLVHEARDLYDQCLLAAGRESFHGFCGLATSYQLWKLGINESLEIHDGNKQFDAYSVMQMTSGGYTVQAYGAPEYTLQTALDAITASGKKDVKNLLVGFQWTNTEAGATYGHACVVNAIEDGVVYFTESFDYAMGYMEGQTITCTIDKFVEFFADWTTFEGVIYFGEKQYSDSCAATEADTYLQLRFDSNLRSQPCLIGENDCTRIRNLSAGELLYTTGIYENEYGDRFYQVTEGETVGYVSANAVFEAPAVPEGWTQENGKWYCYENGQPRTGWVVRLGVNYYLQADGSATTGWAEVEGKRRYFSPTGALCRGWITDLNGTFYQGADGALLTGLQIIEGNAYHFSGEGVLLEQDSLSTTNWVANNAAVPSE